MSGFPFPGREPRGADAVRKDRQCRSPDTCGRRARHAGANSFLAVEPGGPSGQRGGGGGGNGEAAGGGGAAAGGAAGDGAGAAAGNGEAAGAGAGGGFFAATRLRGGGGGLCLPLGG